MALTFIQSNSSHDNASSSTATVTLTGVTAGSLVTLFVGFIDAGGTTSVSVQDDLGQTFTLTPQGLRNDGGSNVWLACLYRLVANSGSRTYTATFGAARAFREMYAFEHSYSGTAAFDVENANGSAGGTTAVTSGNITTTGSDEVVLACCINDTFAAMVSPQIGGVAASHSVDDAGPMGTAWERVTTLSGAGASATASISDWVCLIESFKVTGAGNSSSVSPSVSPSSSASPSVSPSVSPSSSVSSSASPSVAPPAFVERTVFVYID